MTAPDRPVPHGRAADSAARTPGSAAPREYLPVFDVIRIVAVAGVVAIHVIGGTVKAGRGGPGLALLDMALIAAVPIFFMMSGAFALSPVAMRDGATGFWRRRALRLLPPLIMWSAFYILVIRWGVSARRPTAGDVADAVITGQTYTHLYFLWALLGLCAIAPALWELIAPDEGRRAWLLGAAACAWTAVTTALPHLTDGRHHVLEIGTLTFFLVYAGYFVLGRAAVVAPLPRRFAPLALGLWLACTAALTALPLHPQPGRLLSALAPSYVSVLTMIGAVCLHSAVLTLALPWRVGDRTGSILRELGEATFGIYLAHFAIIVALREHPWFAAEGANALAATWVIALGGAAVFAVIARRVPGLRRLV